MQSHSEPCPKCGQEVIEGGETWCKPCQNARWTRDYEVQRLFVPAKPEIPGQQGLGLE